jgi:ribosome-associated toxin RatA of RatAB toxin-antitoxin module
MTTDRQPERLSTAQALEVIRRIAADTARIFIVEHARRRQRQRTVTRRQIERCCQKGTIVEGPFRNAKGHWQASLFRHAAGEEITCVVAIEWAERLVVVTVFRGR